MQLFHDYRFETDMERYDIYRADFPYKETDGEKNRPSLIVSVTNNGAKVLKITSKGKTRETHLEIFEWENAGLSEKSYIEYDSLSLLENQKIYEKVGRLSAIDIFHIEDYLLYGKKL